MSDHYSLLVRPDLTVDRAMLMRIAHRAAAQEHAGFEEIGATAWTYRRCLSQAMRQVWERVRSVRKTMEAKRAAPIRLDPVTAIRREIELLPFMESHTAAHARRRQLETELARLAA